MPRFDSRLALTLVLVAAAASGCAIDPTEPTTTTSQALLCPVGKICTPLPPPRLPSTTTVTNTWIDTEPTFATLRFVTYSASGGAAIARVTGGGTYAQDVAATTSHALTLGGLQPCTAYGYSITIGGVPAHAGTFRTAGCPGDNAGETIALAPSGSTPWLHTLHFPGGVSSGITAIPGLPSDVYWNGAASAQLSLDARSETYVFDGDSETYAGGLRAASLFDTSPPPAHHYAALPYATSVALSGVGPIQTVRRYDHGLCYASVGYDTLDNGFAAAVNRSLSSCPGAAYSVRTRTAPIFVTNPTADGAPTTAVGLSDQIFFDLTVTGTTMLSVNGKCTVVPLSLALDTRLQTGLAVVPGPGGAGTRVTLAGFQLLDGDALGARSPGFDENQANSQISSSFQASFPGQINSSFALPDFGALVGTLLPITDESQLTTCSSDAECLAAVGPEDGCFHPSTDDGKMLSPLVVSWIVNKQLHDDGKGVCVRRLEPKRVNVTPTGLEIVLVDDPADPQYQIVHAYAQLAGSSGLVCPDAVAAAPSGVAGAPTSLPEATYPRPMRPSPF